MCEPWYQCVGPSYKEVRKDVKRIILENEFIKQQMCDELMLNIEECICNEIPENRNDFGSYRGYFTFKVANEISDVIIKKLS